MYCPVPHVTGVPCSSETLPSQDPTVGLYLGSYGGLRGGGLFLMSQVPLYMDIGGGLPAPRRSENILIWQNVSIS